VIRDDSGVISGYDFTCEELNLVPGNFLLLDQEHAEAGDRDLGVSPCLLVDLIESARRQNAKI
jgi:hypothetical protein